jgi:MoaA/NifB/PqqE/SkfB family radical SAM enzyme
MGTFLSAQEIHDWQPEPLPTDDKSPLQRTRERMQRWGQWADWQMMGRRMAMGCVALEVTQRCNLDCSYCYLSESSEALKDIPLAEVMRRIDDIHRFYGPDTDIQVTGGDPTLRDHDELVLIVQAIKQRGMNASLFTNGIKASHTLLQRLSEVGLDDVAFHVDLTQQRAGYASEAELNQLRLEYIERCHGLPLSILFNTTVFPGNFAEIPDLVRFFVQQADQVRLASFQVGADTGRGEERERVTINPETVINAINQGAGSTLNFDAASAGHARCNAYAYGVIINGKVHDFFYDPDFVHAMLRDTAQIRFERREKRRSVRAMGNFLLSHPRHLLGFTTRVAQAAWRLLPDLVQARGKIGKISFFVHNFMDAAELERERCEACSFMVMTGQGPLSMCVHNAKRDTYLLQASQVQRENKILFFNPANGQLEDRMPDTIRVELTRKNARGRAKPAIPPPVSAVAPTAPMAPVTPIASVASVASIIPAHPIAAQEVKHEETVALSVD